MFLGFHCGSAGEESACNTGDLGSTPGLRRSTGEGKGYPLQYSGLENSMDCTVHRVAKSQTRPSNFHFTSLHFNHNGAAGSDQAPPGRPTRLKSVSGDPRSGGCFASKSPVSRVWFTGKCQWRGEREVSEEERKRLAFPTSLRHQSQVREETTIFNRGITEFVGEAAGLLS